MKLELNCLRRAFRPGRSRWLFCAAVYSGLLSVAALADVEVARHWASPAPTINGTVSAGEWTDGTSTTLAHGQMRTMNDGSFLYILLDVVDDTVNDAGVADYYVLAVDVDLNKGITPNVDLIYDACQDGQPFVKAYYLGGSTFTGCQTTSAASLGSYGFGPTFNSATPHRFFEFRLDFAEIGVNPATWTTAAGDIPKVRVNVATISQNPAFSSAQPDPSPFPNLSNTFQIDLATFPDYPPGTAGPTFAGVGLVPNTPAFIDAAGYANINIAGYYSATAAPFGGKLNIFGHWNTLSAMPGVKKYRVLYSKDGGPFARLRQTWTNFRFDGTTWLTTAIGPDADDAYRIPPPAEIWYLPNLLISWQSGLFGDGTYTFRLELLNNGGGVLPPPPANSLTLFVDNTPPAVKINQVLYDGSGVCACAIVTQGDDPHGFTFDISATDAHGALGGFGLSDIFGDNQGSSIYSDTYNSGGSNLGVGFGGTHANADGPEQWNGVTNLIVPTGPAKWRAGVSCAYSFILSASSRIQNGYGLVFPHVQYHVSLTVLLGAGAGSVTGCGP